jgi:Phage capsid family
MSVVTKAAAQRRLDELVTDIKIKTARMDRGEISPAELRAALAGAEAEAEELQTQIKSYNVASQWQAGNEIDGYDRNARARGGNSIMGAAMRSKGIRFNAPSPMHADREQFKGLFEAAKHRQPYSFEVGTKGMGDWNVGTKSPVAETSFGGLPSIIMPANTLSLPFEPDRLFTHFQGQDMPGPSVEFIQHTGNAATAAVVAENALKPDISPQLTTQTVTAVKLAALASISWEAFSDFSYFENWLPLELTRAIIDEETDLIANGTGASGALPGMVGLLNTPGTLTRVVGTSEAPIDTMLEAFNDLRVGSAFANADLVVTNPTTWTFLKTQKSTTGLYVLAQNNPGSIGAMSDLWGVKVVVNTRIPVGTAIVLDTTQAVLAWTRQGMTIDTNMWGDTEFRNNQITFRAEERIQIGVQRPTAVNIVTGLVAAT